MTKIAIIVATDENNAIGKNGDLLCHLPNDLKFFKSVTTGYPVIMGRKTFESLPKGALPNRRNIVITRNKDLQYERCEMASSIDEALDLCKDEEQVFFIGGGTIYEKAIDFADTLYITRIHHQFEGVDTFFPVVDEKVWKKAWSEEQSADEKNKYVHTFIRFEKI